jgi:hypothetical protein
MALQAWVQRLRPVAELAPAEPEQSAAAWALLLPQKRYC